MASQRFSVEAQEDFLEQLTRASPLQAVAELIWNGLDADATRIEISPEQSVLGLTGIVVRDDGHGIKYEEARDLFRRLGGSWKRPGGRTRQRGRILHGYEGRGRLKALALGRVADWHVTYDAEDDSRRSYTISLIANRVREGEISEEQESSASETGVEVRISEPYKDFRSLRLESATQELTEVFALYLKDYRDVTIRYAGKLIDPTSAISSSKSLQLEDIEDEDETHPVTLEIIEWRSATRRILYLCNEAGFPLSQVETRFHVGDFHFSAYLRSSFVNKLHGDSVLELAEMNPIISDTIEKARQCIKSYARDRAAERARLVVQDWKNERVYPYEGDAKTPIEEAERKVFDIVAVTASDYVPDFDIAPKKNKAFHLRMLRSAIEKSPDELQLILNEVLDLPKKKQKELADLLRETSLSSIISAAKTVADRLNFITALEMILFNPEKKKKLKERSQLHRILAENTWVFGEEFNLSVDDQSLTEVLRKHRQLTGDEIVINKPVKHISKKRGIIDLMLSRAIRRHRPAGIEHLVVELKRPSVKIGSKEVTQIEEYAISVANDERFRGVEVAWYFWVLSDDYDEYTTHRITNDEGLISSKGNINIGIKMWGQIIEENRARLQFFQEKLEHQVDQGRALARLQERYSEFLKGVIAVSDVAKAAGEEEDVDLAPGPAGDDAD